jgi:anti-anti-sigma factor
VETGTVLYAKQDSTYVLKFVGEIRYTLGHALDEFLDQLFTKADFDDIVIDLTAATSIDSTGLGLLAKIANFMRGRFGKRTNLVSTNADVNEVLDSVGFYDVFAISSDGGACEQPAQPLIVPELSGADLAKTVLDAHRVLSDLNQANQEQFKSVIDAIKGELQNSH